MKLDGVITEFCDIFAPISQILRKQALENGLIYVPSDEDNKEKNNLRKPQPLMAIE